jgi:hypothetical protein
VKIETYPATRTMSVSPLSGVVVMRDVGTISVHIEAVSAWGLCPFLALWPSHSVIIFFVLVFRILLRVWLRLL